MRRLIQTIALCLTASCASIVSGGPEQVQVSTTPPGAAVYFAGQHVGTSPCLVQVPRKKQDATLRFVLDGYHNETRKLQSDVNGWIVGNIVFGLIGCPLGLLIDFSTGSAWTVQDTVPTVTMRPKDGVEG
jgi:hypothetical protein